MGDFDIKGTRHRPKWRKIEIKRFKQSAKGIMRAGPMTYRLEILRPVTVTDRFGAESVTYEATRTVHAERVRETGRRAVEIGEMFPDHDATYNIRDAHPVAENWRVREVGGPLYWVAAIVPNRAAGYNTLICRRVNE